MKKDWKFYMKLFSATFRISAFTFGGGFVIIPLLSKKIVNEYHWMKEDEMLKLTAIAQSAPGGVAVNASIIIGYRLAGIWGTIVTLVATVLPPLIILSGVSLVYTAFQDSTVVQALLKGFQIGVLAVIADVVIDLAVPIIKEKKAIPILIMSGTFVCSYFLGVNVILLLLISGVAGALLLRKSNPKQENREQKTTIEDEEE